MWTVKINLVTLFESSKANINEHINNIVNSGELDEEPTVRKFRTVRKEGNREVKRNLIHYNLDMIISVGYSSLIKEVRSTIKYGKSPIA